MGPGADHMPILTVIDLQARRLKLVTPYNFCVVNWDKFREELEARLEDVGYNS